MKTFLLCMACWLLGCTGSKASSKPLVVTSLPPYVSIVQAIAGDYVDVISFLEEDDNPHTFEPTPKEMQTVERAMLWIGVGEPFENRVTRVMNTANPHSKILDLTTTTPTVQGDRHIWMSLRLMKSQAIAISEAIAQITPDQALKIKANTTALIKQLDKLDQQIFRQLLPLHGQALLVAHPSFTYFCNDYNLVQVPVESEGKDPLPTQLQVIFEMAKTTKFRCAITVPQGNNKGTGIIAEKMRLPIYSFNPLAENYLENMDHLAHLIAQ
ncbi:MAG: zinc ABC transporter substrate-binding protein [Chlamydiia bacterium]|nr:zinc ABC transporter substrate-binding protein [Chlamydiia bacterium]MCP5509654.1 zinc ABC transporter substrate-binding protein [Chlamydiales bacterium]HPE85639.1 zinc ABC transporter substrate-binding protein [Chlamydiales bacterium]